MLETSLSALTEQAWSLVEANRLDEARMLFRNICEADGSDPEAWMMLGSLQAEFVEDGDAIVCLEKALQLDPTYPDAHYNLARIRGRQGHVEDAQKHCRMAVDADPGYAAAWQLFGAIHETLGNFSDSETCSRRAIALLPGNPASHANLALALWKQGKLQESIQSYRKSLELDARQVDVWLQLAAVFTHLNLLSDAEQCYRKAISLDPEKIEAYERLSGVLVRQGRLGEEIDTLLVASRLKPDNASIHLQLGKAFHAQRRWDAAANSFKEAIRLAPGNAEAYFGFGAVYGAKEMKQEELGHFRHALRLDPENAQYRFHVARLTGEGAPATAPQDYVKTLFDACAQNFDAHLVGQLAYKGHGLVHQAVIEHMSEAWGNEGVDILDLGCGTGLCAPLLKSMANNMSGIDLSERMVDVARKLNLYDRLVVGDISAELEGVDERHDLIVAADVFIYVGDLARVMERCSVALKRPGLLVFTVEAAKDENADYVLESSGRYSHSMRYLRGLAGSLGLEVSIIRNAVLRMERETPINGYVVAMRRQA